MEPELIFRAMADRTRQRALAVLARQELSVSELVTVLRQPQSTVSRHLKALRHAGLIRDRREGPTVLYAISNEAGAANGGTLTNKILEWTTDQALHPQLQARLDNVLQRRREMSDRFFGDVGRQWDTMREDSFGSAFHLEAFWSLLPSEWTVADIGTGSGYLLPALAAHFALVVAIDPVEAMLESARQRIETGGLENVTLRQGDLSRLPVDASSVDLAVALLVLHHTAVPLEAVRELFRILRAGGVVLVVEQVAHDGERFRNRMQDRWSGFEPHDLRRQFEQVGFENVRPHRLTTVKPADDAPDLFAMTARKAAAAS